MADETRNQPCKSDSAAPGGFKDNAPSLVVDRVAAAWENPVAAREK